MNNDLIFWGKKELQHYDGLLIRADLGLHEQVAKRVKQILPDGGDILDLGCGQGAMSARLRDLGYTVTAVDVDPDDFKCEGIEYDRVDFNVAAEREAFVRKNSGRFDLVVGLEVIEHVENHWDYIRLLKTLLKNGGWLLVSTPNVTSWISRFQFLFKGQFHQFFEEDLQYGHISPITPWHLEHVLRSEGLSNIKLEPAGTLPPLFFDGFTVNSVIHNVLNIIFYPFMRGIKHGWCIIATAKK